MKHLIILNDPPYGTERSFNGQRMAQALSKHDPEGEVTVFLMADAVRRLRSLELQQLRARQLAAEDHRSVCPGAVCLKHVLGQIQADDANLTHGRSPL